VWLYRRDRPGTRIRKIITPGEKWRKGITEGDPATRFLLRCQSMCLYNFVSPIEKFIEKALSWYGEGTGSWHDKLRQSTGIRPQKSDYPPLVDNPRLVELYEKSLPHYKSMLEHRLVIDLANPE
jgi:hypothetical protein